MLPLDLEGLVEGIVERGLRGLSIDEQLSAFASSVHAAGFPMKRVNISMRTLHPRYGALSFVWHPDANEVDLAPQQRGIEEIKDFEQSPIHYLLTSGSSGLRRRLDTADELPFPILDDLREAGMTEYAAQLVSYDRASHDGGATPGLFFSCATDVPTGFDDTQLDQVADLLPYLAMAIKARLTYDVARTITATYLGEDAGRRVLTGEIERGSAESIQAVIWFCDLRGFTGLGDRLSRDELVPLLDDYLEVMARPVHAKGGQILKFMGDGFLATFDLTERNGADVCRDALEVAIELRSDFSRLNGMRSVDGRPVLDFGLALNVGDVFYGNIGAIDRLDFTVVGPAVNEASRIQDLCRPLDCDVLVSSAFRDLAGDGQLRLKSIGRHELRDLDAPRELFTLACG